MQMREVLGIIRQEFQIDEEFYTSVLLTSDCEPVSEEMDVAGFYMLQQKKYAGATRIYIGKWWVIEKSFNTIQINSAIKQNEWRVNLDILPTSTAQRRNQKLAYVVKSYKGTRVDSDLGKHRKINTNEESQ